MAKKKKRKSAPKKKTDISKKEFQAFARGVDRLKELEKELKSLDTRGFYKDEQYIRSRLKSVSEIPNIEKAVKKLKFKNKT